MSEPMIIFNWTWHKFLWKLHILWIHMTQSLMTVDVNWGLLHQITFDPEWSDILSDRSRLTFSYNKGSILWLQFWNQCSNVFWNSNETDANTCKWGLFISSSLED